MDLLASITETINAACVPGKAQELLALDGSRNPDCWAAGFNLTCRAESGPYDVHGGPTGIAEEGKTTFEWAVSADHLLTHPVTGTCRFRKRDGSGFIERTIIADEYVPDGKGWDVRMIRLSAPIAVADVQPAVLPPGNFDRYFASQYVAIPALTIMAAFADDVLRACTQDARYYGMFATTLPSPRGQYYRLPTSGCSGSPALTSIGGLPVLLGTWLGPNYAPSLFLNRGAMEATASEMKGEAVTFATVDLSAYDQPVQETPPVIAFTTSAAQVASGGAAALSWAVTGATYVSISGVGTVAASGTAVVHPTATTTYILSAGWDSAQVDTRTVTVGVAVEAGSLYGSEIVPKYYLWKNQDADGLDIYDPTCWLNATDAGVSLGTAAEQPPVAGDTCFVKDTSLFGNMISGGTLNANLVFLSGSDFQDVSDLTVNGNVISAAGVGAGASGLTINGNLAIASFPSPDYSVVSGTTTATGTGHLSGVYHGDLSKTGAIDTSGATINSPRISLDGGETWYASAVVVAAAEAAAAAAQLATDKQSVIDAKLNIRLNTSILGTADDERGQLDTAADPVAVAKVVGIGPIW